jgi:hypothetical protein
VLKYFLLKHLVLKYLMLKHLVLTYLLLKWWRKYMRSRWISDLQRGFESRPLYSRPFNTDTRPPLARIKHFTCPCFKAEQNLEHHRALFQLHVPW